MHNICASKKRPPGKNQNAALFNRGKATSCTPNCVGSKKFANAPNNNGIIIKNTITTPCAEATVKYCKLSPANAPIPGYANSKRIAVARAKPAIPETKTNKK